MGVHLTDDTHVAMFDSVTGFAFGPTFDNEEDALDFIEFLHDRGFTEPRGLTDPDLEAEHLEWAKQQCPVCGGRTEITPSGARTCREHGSSHLRVEATVPS